MEQILLGLVGSSPAAAATIITVVLFLRYLREERIAWHSTITTALNNNTQAMQSQTSAMVAQAEALRALNLAIEKHDFMAREAIARLEQK